MTLAVTNGDPGFETVNVLSGSARLLLSDRTEPLVLLKPPAPRVLSADEWAAQQFAQVDLGDQRLNRRALEMGAKMAAHPEASLPNQMESRC